MKSSKGLWTVKELGDWSCDFLAQGASATLEMLWSRLGFTLVGFLGTEGDPKCHSRSGQALCVLASCPMEQLLWAAQEQGMCNMIFPALWRPGVCPCASRGLHTVHQWFQLWELPKDLYSVDNLFFKPLLWTSVMHTSLVSVNSVYHHFVQTPECLIWFLPWSLRSWMSLVTLD